MMVWGDYRRFVFLAPTSHGRDKLIIHLLYMNVKLHHRFQILISVFAVGAPDKSGLPLWGRGAF